MVIIRKTLSVASSAHTQFVDITSLFCEQIPPNFTGLCNLFSLHTTAALMINENADPDVLHDLARDGERITPWHNAYYQHAEGNSAAHWKTACFGSSLTVQIENGKWIRGTWQGIYMCEFDGARHRTISLMFMGE